MLAPLARQLPGPAGGTEVHPQFDRAAIVAWLLADDKIEVPIGMPSASLVVVDARRRTARFRLDAPPLILADDAEGEDELSSWSTDAEMKVKRRGRKLKCG
ncbi:hypothetical protein J7E99_31315 [Streptomyces sp. ISL-44]|uniref:hypothetical protein n=1 Tax=Streptomyces sp. ISL-44 TaxID=2819184 RepID=UPI001BE85E18|nr:hypothetical protein [Streptomyces sp. ISL-44]MBT2545070.1 hypothetical protein [Streptomyces sp. ISL-44]